MTLTIETDGGDAVKIRVEHGEFEENEVVLRCRELDAEMLELLAILRERAVKLATYKDGVTHMISPNEIFYVDSVDGNSFVYIKDNVLETPQSLARLEELHTEAGLLRIGKSQLVNLYHVVSLRSMANSRIEITLENNEKLIASRHYTQNLKEKIGILE